MSSTPVTPPPTPPSYWDQFATFAAGPSGRFIVVLITASLVAADLVAVGPSWVAGATVIAVAVLYTPLITRNIHERALAALIGALVALYLIMGLEIYLGATGFRYGPIGAIGRGSLGGVDQRIIWFLNCFYRNGGWFKSGFGPIVFVVAYFVVFGILSATHANRLNNIWTASCGFIVVVLMFPFAHGFEGKQVAFTKATLSVSSSLKTLGAYEPAKQEAIKENGELRGFLAELNDQNHQKEREALKQAIRTYAQRLLKLDDEGRARTQILYRPDDAYVASQFLPLPPVTYPPRDEPEVKAAEADPYDQVSVTSVAHAEELLRKRDSFIDEVAHLRHDRDTAPTDIRIFVGNEVNATLGEQRRTEVADDARSAVMQIVALHNMADATRALEAKNAELRDKIDNQEKENATLRDAVAQYRQFRLDYLRRDADCSQLR